MKNLKQINDETQIVEQGYNVCYHNKSNDDVIINVAPRIILT